jgi:hypothetical protein
LHIAGVSGATIEAYAYADSFSTSSSYIYTNGLTLT